MKQFLNEKSLVVKYSNTDIHRIASSLKLLYQKKQFTHQMCNRLFEKSNILNTKIEYTVAYIIRFMNE